MQSWALDGVTQRPRAPHALSQAALPHYPNRATPLVYNRIMYHDLFL
jgi:hypothetical protein